jgi:hypothetical protein
MLGDNFDIDKEVQYHPLGSYLVARIDWNTIFRPYVVNHYFEEAA